MDALALTQGRTTVSEAARSRDARESAEIGPVSFEAVFETHYRDVARYVVLVTRGLDDAEEIVAEAFARGFAAWREGRGPTGRPLPWLLVIARRIAADRSRRRRLIAWLPITGSRGERTVDPGAPDANTAEREFWLWLDALSRALPARQREVLILRYQRDLTDAEIGEILQMSTSGVRTLASRALHALRQHPELWS